LAFRDLQWLSLSIRPIRFVSLPQSTFPLVSPLFATFLNRLSLFLDLPRTWVTFAFDSINSFRFVSLPSSTFCFFSRPASTFFTPLWLSTVLKDCRIRFDQFVSLRFVSFRFLPLPSSTVSVFSTVFDDKEQIGSSQRIDDEEEIGHDERNSHKKSK
jgi:hypothetical protein